MSKLILTNNHMQLEIIAIIGDDAFLKRLNDSSFVVCRNIDIKEDLTCSWGYALGYFEHYDDAYACFVEKVVNEFTEYGNTETKYKEFIQWILDQWEIHTKEVQDKALELIGADK